MKQRLISLGMIAAGVLLATVTARAQIPAAERAVRIKEEAAKPTPRLADGHPDLTGYWADPIAVQARRLSVSADGKTAIYPAGDAPELDGRAQPNFKIRANDRSRRPPYYPQFVAKQKELMYTATNSDKGLTCYPFGVPRIGAPTEIVSTPTTQYFMYSDEAEEDPVHTFRIIPIGAKHDPERDPRPDGDSIAFWEGDTLVVDVVNLDPETWLSGDGDFHDENLHVVERFTRKGNTLDYEVIIEDPTLWPGQWKPVFGFAGSALFGHTGARTRILRPAGEHAPPDYPCVERDAAHKVNNDRP